MVLKKDKESVVRWGKEENKWVFEDRITYCWTNMKGLALSDYFLTLDEALDFAVKSGTQ